MKTDCGYMMTSLITALMTMTVKITAMILEAFVSRMWDEPAPSSLAINRYLCVAGSSRVWWKSDWLVRHKLLASATTQYVVVSATLIAAVGVVESMKRHLALSVPWNSRPHNASHMSLALEHLVISRLLNVVLTYRRRHHHHYIYFNVTRKARSPVNWLPITD